MEQKEVLLIIPAYNEEKNIGKVMDQLAKVRRYFNSKNEFPLLIIFMKSTFYNVTLMQY